LTALRFNFNVTLMTDDRKSGIALITGMAGTIITMALHPTGHDLTSGHAASTMQLNVAVHTLALVCVPILFLGTLGLTQRLASPNRLALSGLVLFGFAEVAVMIAAAASGLIAPGLFHPHVRGRPGCGRGMARRYGTQRTFEPGICPDFYCGVIGCYCDLVSSNPQKQHLQPGTRNLRLYSGPSDHRRRSFRTYTA
jgi:hypothetical protein